MEGVTLDSWKGIVENYLKADNLDGIAGNIIVENVKLTTKKNDNGEIVNRIEIETTHDGKQYLFPLNWTNTKFIRDNINSPKELLGKSLKWEKVKVHNPQTQQMQDGIAIVGIA